MGMTTWPGGAKGAFAFGWDLDGDTIWNHKIKNLPGGLNNIRSRSAGWYGPQKGAYRILETMSKYNLKATWFVPAVNVEKYPELVRMIQSAGHEIAHHGYDHDSHYGNTPDEQWATIQKCQDIFRKVLKKPAVGFRPTGSLLPETKSILFNDPNTLYTSEDIGKEHCHFHTVNGYETSAVHLPCRQELDDYIQTVYNMYPSVPKGLPRIAPYTSVLGGFVREIEGTLQYGNAVSTAFHPQVSGTPGKAMLLEKLCQYITSNPDIWCTTCENIARYWKDQQGGNE